MLNKRWFGRFERNPKKTILILLLLVAVTLDLLLGHLLCPKVVGTPDAFYHHGLPRNYDGPRKWGGETYHLFTNSLGFKDDWCRQVARTSEKYRLVIIGDSFAEGVGYPFEETFPGLLQERVDSAKVEVLNAGVVSYSPKLYYLKASYLLKNVGLRFDELIVYVDISDIQDEIAYEPFVPAGRFGISKFYLINRIDSFLRQNSVTYHAVAKTFSHRLPGLARLQEEDEPPLILDQEFTDNWYIETSEWTSNPRVFKKWGERGVASALHYMEQLRELCRAYGIKMTVAVYPWPAQILRGEIDSRQVSIWEKFCRDNDARFINYFPVFMDGRGAEQVLKEYFIPGDVHWNRAGHRLVADVLYQKWKSWADD